MKKILALTLALVMLLSLGACSKRPASTPDASAPQSSSDAPTVSLPEETPDTEPEQTPAQSPEDEPEQTPSQPPEQQPEESPEQTPEQTPEQEPDETPEQQPDNSDNTNDGKVDSSANVASTATDLSPADDSFLSLVPELPFENWASTSVDANTIMLELRGVGADAQSALMEYIQTLRDEDFDVTEYIYGSLYEASADGVIITLMLEGGTFTITIEKV